MPEKVRGNGEYKNAINYSDPQNAKLTFENKFNQELRRSTREHVEEYRQFTGNKSFREWLINTLFNLDYEPYQTASKNYYILISFFIMEFRLTQRLCYV